MKRSHPLFRALLLALCVSQAAPQFAWALRVEQSPKVRAGLEESLQPEPAAGLEEEVQEFAQLVQRMDAIQRGRERTGLLKKRIDEIRSDEYFTEGGVAYLPYRVGKAVVLGDRHGDFATLEKEMDRVTAVTGYDPARNRISDEPVVLIFVGDYTDIGSKTLQVMLRILRLAVEDPEHVVLVSGNHDRSRNTYDSADFLEHPEEPWFFRDLDSAMGGPDRAKEIYDQWQKLVLGQPEAGYWGMPNLVVLPNGITVIHASPPNATLDAPEYGTRFDSTQGLLGVCRNREILHQLSWNFINRGKADKDPNAPGVPNTRFKPVHDWQGLGFWTDRKDFELFMDSFGGAVLVRGHDSEAPWDWTPYGGRLLTVMGLDHRSPDNGYSVEKEIRARFAVFDLARRYDRIDPAEVTHFAWKQPAAGLEERIREAVDKLVRPEALRNWAVAAGTRIFMQDEKERIYAEMRKVISQGNLKEALKEAGIDQHILHVVSGMAPGRVAVKKHSDLDLALAARVSSREQFDAVVRAVRQGVPLEFAGVEQLGSELLRGGPF